VEQAVATGASWLRRPINAPQHVRLGEESGSEPQGSPQATTESPKGEAKGRNVEEPGPTVAGIVSPDLPKSRKSTGHPDAMGVRLRLP